MSTYGITCWLCDGTGQVAVRNTFTHALSSVLVAKCPECDGCGVAHYCDYEDPIRSSTDKDV